MDTHLESLERLKGVRILARQDDIISSDGRVTLAVFRGHYGTVIAEFRGTDRKPERSWQRLYLDNLSTAGDAAWIARRILAGYSGLDPKLESVLTEAAEREDTQNGTD